MFNFSVSVLVFETKPPTEKAGGGFRLFQLARAVLNTLKYQLLNSKFKFKIGYNHELYVQGLTEF